MNEYYWHGKKLRQQIEEITSVKRVTIATAYFSWEGLSI